MPLAHFFRTLFALFKDGDFASSAVSPALDVLERVSLTKQGVEELRRLPRLAEIARSGSQSVGSVALSWLMRAWREPDPVSRFLALFTPLEMVLQGYGGGEQPEAERRAASMRHLLATHDGENKEELLRYFEHLVKLQRPGLPAWFRQMAQRAGMPGWERDADAFHRFNQLRNALLHRGDPGIRLVVAVSDEEVRQLQDIVERYVSQSLFGDGAVYQSSHRWTKPPRLSGAT